MPPQRACTESRRKTSGATASRHTTTRDRAERSTMRCASACVMRASCSTCSCGRELAGAYSRTSTMAAAIRQAQAPANAVQDAANPERKAAAQKEANNAAESTLLAAAAASSSRRCERDGNSTSRS